MPCEQSDEIDLLEFLLERGDPRFAEFRAHYPGCSDCSREVGRLTRLEQSLGHSAPQPAGPHPEEAELLGYAQSPTTLGVVERRSLEAHLDLCAPCRSEVAVMERFDFADIGVVMASDSAAARTSLWQQVSEGVSEVLENLAGWAKQPAVLAAAAALVLLPVVWLLDRTGIDEVAQPTGSFASRTPSGSAVVEPMPMAPVLPSESVIAPQLAAIPEPAPAPMADAIAPESVPLEATELAAAPTPTPAADIEVEPSAAPSVDKLVAGPDLMLLAAHWPDSPIQYGVDEIELLGGAPVRTHGNVRSSGAQPALRLRAIAPEHVGWTSGPSPTLYYWLSEATELPIEVTLSDETSIEPLVEFRSEGPHAEGLHKVSLKDLAVKLDSGVIYRWQIAAVRDPSRRSRDIRAGAGIVWQAPDAAVLAVLEASHVGQRAHRLAEQGYWYDAFEQLSDWIDAGSTVAGLQDARIALLDQVGMEGSEAGAGSAD